MNDHWDAIVVGAGPAGAVAAMLLARAGRRTAIVDAAHFPRQKVCGEFLSAEAWRIIHELRIEVPRPHAVRHVSLSGAGRRFTSPIRPEQRRFPAALGRDAFDSALVAAAVHAGAEFYSGLRVRRVSIDAGRATGLETVDVVDPHRTLTLEAPLIIAADGRNSFVVRQTGNLRSAGGGLVGFKRHVSVEPEAWPRFADTITMHALPGGYAGICPTQPGIVNVCGVMPKTLLRKYRGRLDDALRAWSANDAEACGFFAPLETHDAWHAVGDVSQQFARPNVAGVLYVGDAAGTIEPLAGQGMTMALAGAKLAAEHLIRAGTTVFDRDRQRAYDRAWHAKFDRTIAAAGWFGAVLRRPQLLGAMIAVGGAVHGIGDWIMQTAYRRASVAA